MEQEYLNKYKIKKTVPGELELKGYLHQLIGEFIDKRSFLSLAVDITLYIHQKGMYEKKDQFDYAYKNIHNLSHEQVKAILQEFNILPDYLYYFEEDAPISNQSSTDKIHEALPIFYCSFKEVSMQNGSLLFIFRAGGYIVDVISDFGKKLKISEELEYMFESNYFTSCKISRNKRGIILRVLDRMEVWVEYLYENQMFVFKKFTNQLVDNFYDLCDIDDAYEKYLLEMDEINNLKESVKIGYQIWKTRNLDVTHFSNGDLISEAQSEEEWEMSIENKKPAWCFYNNNKLNGEKYGKLYNWYAINDSRGLAPKGWHIPSLEEWEKLADGLGENGNIKIQGGLNEWKEDTEMKDFFSSFFDGNDVEEEEEKIAIEEDVLFNQTGLTILPGGGRGRFGNAFYGKGDSAYFWTATSFDNNEDESNEAYFVLIHINDKVMQTGGYTEKKVGFSVRCIKD